VALVARQRGLDHVDGAVRRGNAHLRGCEVRLRESSIALA
jgi:hypothetical protein